MENMDTSIFWSKVLQTLLKKEKNVEWLCKETGLSLRTMKNRISKGIQPRLSDAVKILEVFGTTLEEFCEIEKFTYKSESNSVSVPVYSQLFSAGHGQFLPDEDEISGYVYVPDSLKSIASHLAATKVRGDSMEPTLCDGDTIVCDNMGYDGNDGIFVIQYKGMGFVKRIHKTAKTVSIISDNPVYKIMEEPASSEDLRIIGKVRYVKHA